MSPMPSDLSRGLVSMLDHAARDAILRAMVADAARHYDAERADVWADGPCPRCGVAPADVGDPYLMCGECAARDAGGRS